MRRFIVRLFLFLVGIVPAATVEAMGADLALGHANSLDERLYLVEAQRGQAEPACHLVDHPLVFR